MTTKLGDPLFMTDRPVIVQEIHPATAAHAAKLSFGQAGLAFASVLALVALNSLDGLLWWAVLAFSVSIPFGICHGLLSQDWSAVPFSTPGWRRVAAAVSTATHLSVFLGVALIFLHVSILHMAVFVLISFGSFFLWRRQTKLLHKVREGLRQGRLQQIAPTSEQ